MKQSPATFIPRWVFIVTALWAFPVAAAVQQPFETLEQPPYRFLYEKGMKKTAEALLALAPAELERMKKDLGISTAPTPVTVYLTRGKEVAPVIPTLPGWAAGGAVPNLHVIVLRTDRLGYPYKQVQDVFVHELCHLLLHEAAGRGGLPRWFEEGTCMIEAREWKYYDAYHVLAGIFFRGTVTPDGIDALFYAGTADAQSAYALSFSLVSFVIQEYGHSAIRKILRFTGEGLPFDKAFDRATDTPLWVAAAEWEHRTASTYRLIPILTSSTTLWLVITLLFLFAFRRKKLREKAILERWELEDGEGGPYLYH